MQFAPQNLSWTRDLKGQLQRDPTHTRRRHLPENRASNPAALAGLPCVGTPERRKTTHTKRGAGTQVQRSSCIPTRQPPIKREEKRLALTRVAAEFVTLNLLQPLQPQSLPSRIFLKHRVEIKSSRKKPPTLCARHSGTSREATTASIAIPVDRRKKEQSTCWGFHGTLDSLTLQIGFHDVSLHPRRKQLCRQESK